MVTVFNHPNRFQAIFHSLPDLLCRHAQVLRTKSHVFLNDRSYDLIIRILEYHSGALTYIPQMFIFLRVHSVYPHGSVRRNQQGIHMLCKCRLPRAIMPQDRNKLSRLDIQRYLINSAAFPYNITFFVTLCIFKYKFICLDHFHGISSYPFCNLSVHTVLDYNLTGMPMQLIS